MRNLQFNISKININWSLGDRQDVANFFGRNIRNFPTFEKAQEFGSCHSACLLPYPHVPLNNIVVRHSVHFQEIKGHFFRLSRLHYIKVLGVQDGAALTKFGLMLEHLKGSP